MENLDLKRRLSHLAQYMMMIDYETAERSGGHAVSTVTQVWCYVQLAVFHQTERETDRQRERERERASLRDAAVGERSHCCSVQLWAGSSQVTRGVLLARSGVGGNASICKSGAGDCDGPSGRRGAALLAAAALNIADNYNDIRIVAQDTTRRLS